MAKHIIIGTAGHVDHGKTALIKALTGVDTDRLKEEKERGMSIELGFAHMELPSGVVAGVVDVPGHERFLKNMLMGASGTDLVLLVVAADEGVMPQTTEHLDILRLLHVPAGIVALTKIDLVDDEWLALVEEEVRDAVKGTFLEDAEIVRVSSTTGEGIDRLRERIEHLALAVHERSVAGPFRLPIDRVFTMPGFGTVVTGTVASGRVRLGDAVEVLPPRISARVRQIQAHGRKAGEVVAGSRAAINLVGVDVEQLERGYVCATPGALRPSQLLDARLQLLSRLGKPLRDRTRIRLHVGTAEVIGRVVLLDTEELAPGATGFVQFRLESPAVVSRGDPFVVRLFSPMVTLGGGTVLDPAPSKHRRFHQETLAGLRVRESGGLLELLERTVLESGAAGATLASLASATQQSQEAVQSGVKELLAEGRLIALSEQTVIHRHRWEETVNRLSGVLAAYHQENPLRVWMPREELRNRVARGIPAGLFGQVLQRLAGEGRVVVEADGVRLTEHTVVLSAEQEALARRVEARLGQSPFAPPTLSELVAVEGPNVREIVTLLWEQGRLARVNADIYLHAGALERVKEIVATHVRAHGRITAADFRDLTGSSRKYAVPILEYLDSIRFTRRVGDERVLGEH